MLGINFIYKYCQNDTCSQPKFDEMELNETAFAEAVEHAMKEKDEDIEARGLKEVTVAPASSFACRADKNWGRS